jgi:hypothetical protein
MSLIHYQPGGGIQIVGSSKGSGPPGPQGPAGIGVIDCYISAYSTSSQVFTDGGTAPTTVLHQATSIALNASLSGGSIQVVNAGVYKILFSIQFFGVSGNGKFTVFLKINGAVVPNSATTTSFKNGDEGVITVEYIEVVPANGIISFAAYTSGGVVDVFYTPATTVGGQPVPAGPGIITDVYRLASI